MFVIVILLLSQKENKNRIMESTNYIVNWYYIDVKSFMKTNERMFFWRRLLIILSESLGLLPFCVNMYCVCDPHGRLFRCIPQTECTRAMARSKIPEFLRQQMNMILSPPPRTMLCGRLGGGIDFKTATRALAELHAAAVRPRTPCRLPAYQPHPGWWRSLTCDCRRIARPHACHRYHQRRLKITSTI